MQQLGLAFSRARRGGPRAGAGRKRAQTRLTPHRSRAKHQAAHPVHVTLRASLRSLRSQQVARTVLGALRDSRRETFRIAHYSIQDNHQHPDRRGRKQNRTLQWCTRPRDPRRQAPQQTLVPSRIILGRSLARPRPQNPARSAKYPDLRAPKPPQTRLCPHAKPPRKRSPRERRAARSQALVHTRPAVLRRMVQRLRQRTSYWLPQHRPPRYRHTTDLAPPNRLATPRPDSALGVSALSAANTR